MRLTTEVRAWLRSVDEATYKSVTASLIVLAEEGPALGRPLFDTVKGSRFPNMKELRPPAPGRQTIRVLFIFDPARAAILLVAGDKTNDWATWYRRNIPLADRRYERHLAELKKKEGERR